MGRALAAHPGLRHADCASAGQSDHLGGCQAQIEAYASYEWPTIIDCDRDRLASVRIDDEKPRAEWKCAMRRREPVRIERLTTRGVTALPIIRRDDAVTLTAGTLRHRIGRYER